MLDQKFQKKIYALIILSLGIFFLNSSLRAANEEEPKKINLAILPLQTQKSDPSYAKIIRNRIEYLLCKSERFNVLEKNMTELVFRKNGWGGKDITDLVYVVKAGKDVLADYVILGTFEYLEEFLVTVRIVGVRESKIVHAVSVKFKEEEQIYEKAEELSLNLSNFLEDIPDRGLDNILKLESKTYFNTKLHYLKPIKSFKTIFKSGQGINVTLGKKNIFFNNFSWGLSSGFYRLLGENENKYSLIVPLMIENKYSFKIFKRIFISPEVSLGYSYNCLVKDNSTRQSLEPMLRVGFSSFLFLNSNIYADLDFYHSNIFEKDATLEFLSLGGGVGLLY